MFTPNWLQSSDEALAASIEQYPQHLSSSETYTDTTLTAQVYIAGPQHLRLLLHLRSHSSADALPRTSP